MDNSKMWLNWIIELQAIAQNGLTIHKLVTLASIVEKESGEAAESGLVFFGHFVAVVVVEQVDLLLFPEQQPLHNAQQAHTTHHNGTQDHGNSPFRGISRARSWWKAGEVCRHG